MTKAFKTLDDLDDVAGKRVLVREDLNVPMEGDTVSDDTRLRATLPTVTELADKGAVVLILAHFGRPKVPSPELSTAQLARPFSQVLGREVRYIDWEGDAESTATLRAGDSEGARRAMAAHMDQVLRTTRAAMEKAGG